MLSWARSWISQGLSQLDHGKNKFGPYYDLVDSGGPVLRQAESLGPVECHGPDNPVGSPPLTSSTMAGDCADKARARQQAWLAQTPQAFHDLQWWMQPPVWQEDIPFRPGPNQLAVFTDASLKGRGVVCSQMNWKGKWQREFRLINWLELRTVLTALQVLQFSISGKVILFLIDNTTAIAYLRKKADTRSNLFSSWRIAF